jgi:plasmid stabilization system protein ParE
VVEITWTTEAERSLRDIHAYIAADNPSAAPRVVESIYERVQTLRQFPELGYRYERIADRHVRILVHGHYCTAYRGSLENRSLRDAQCYVAHAGYGRAE